MKILLTNDDGIYADGLWALYRQLAGRHSVSVVAPDRERSAVGHGITLSAPIRVSRVPLPAGCRGYAVSGTPADCIKVSLLELLDGRPDLVISGINPGVNIGVNVNYSGTVSAAREAALYGLPAIAVSIEGRKPNHYDEAGCFAAKLADKVFEKNLPFGTLLNVNIPDRPLDQISGVRISSQGRALCSEFVEKRIDSPDQITYWHGLTPPGGCDAPGSDECALKENCISITPMKCDATDYRLLEELKLWKLDIGSAP